MKKYQPKEFENKWANFWDKNKTYRSHEFHESHESYKSYILPMFPYPSGAGLHVGHVRNYTGTDVLARFFRMSGHQVLYPMGWDAFGLPAENAAIKAKKNPMDMVPENIANFKRQMKMLGFSYDWDREFSTTDHEYYKWTQWLFIQFFKMGLLYKKNAPINYCPKCKTGLAEEEVLTDGTHERCGNKITKKDLPQWIFAITKYADRLLSDLEGLDWPEGILAMQKNWIGRKEGINIYYKIIDEEARHRIFESASPPQSGGSPKSLTQKQVSSLPAIDTITCFTTRPDTNFGATFIVIAPEHPFVEKILNPKSEIRNKFKIQNSKLEEIKKYVEEAKSKTETEREAEGRKKTGVFTGFYAVNNLNGRLMPIYISDFVLIGFGTGAVVGVPGHDVRDYQFAQEFNLPVEVVVLPDKNSKFKIQNSKLKFKIKNEWKKGSYEGDAGIVINSDFLNNLSTKEATKKIIDYLEEKGWGKRVVSYHLRDWIFSRQRYWGEPIPMVFCANCAKNQIKSEKLTIKNLDKEIENSLFGWFPVEETNLPLKLPYIKSYEPTETGESPLAKIDKFVNTTCPHCGGPAKRETDTMPNWAGSCWYFLAFVFWGEEARNYVSRPPHPKGTQAIDSKRVSSLLSTENYLHSEALANEWKLKMKNHGSWLPVDWYLGGAEHAVLHLLYARFWVKALYDLGLLDFKEPFLRLRNQGMILAEDHRKMSKSFGNVINPDNIVAEYGADALRIYEMFIAPFNTEIPWSTKALQGSYRFIKRVWEIYHSITWNIERETYKEDKKLVAKLNKTIKKVTEDIKQIKFNTAIAAMMEFLNDWERAISDKNARHRDFSPTSPSTLVGGSPKSLAQNQVASLLNIENAKKFLQILAPFAPFMTEEIWREVFGEKTSIHLSKWPEAEKVEEEEVVIPVQVNGKLRGTIKVERRTYKVEREIEKKALENEKVKKYLEGKRYKMIYVEGKVVNFVILN